MNTFTKTNKQSCPTIAIIIYDLSFLGVDLFYEFFVVFHLSTNSSILRKLVFKWF